MNNFASPGQLDTALGYSGTDKVSALQKAKADKLVQLDQFRQTLANSRVEAARIQARENSWVGQLGLDPLSGTGRAVDLAANFFSGASRTLGDVGAVLSGDASATIMDSGLAEEEIQAIGRFKQGSASPADIELINRRPAKREISALEMGAADPGLLMLRQATEQMTPLERFEAANESRGFSQGIRTAFDKSAAIHPDARDALTDQLKEGSKPLLSKVTTGYDRLRMGELGGLVDMVKGAGSLAVKAGEAALDNPAGVAGFVAENIPQVGVGALGTTGRATLGLSNAGYASGNYQEGIANFQRDNKGAYPSAEQRLEMAGWAAATGLAEHVTDQSILKGAKGAAAVEEGVDAARRSAAQRLKASLLEAGKGAATEAATEGFQTYAEGQAKLDPASAQEIYEGMAIGGMVGGSLQGGGRALGELATPNPKAPKEPKAGAPIKEITDAVVAAQESGNVAPLLNPKASTYAPAQAIAVLERITNKEGTTPEARQAGLAQAGKIVEQLQQELQSYTEELAQLQGVKGDLAKAKEAGDAEKVAKQQAVLDDVDPKGKLEATLQKDIKRVTGLAAQTNEVLARFAQRAVTTEAPQDVDAQIQAINTASDPATATKAAESIINLSMAAPERVSDAQVEALVSNAANGLSDAQRTYLRQFSEARVASNKLQTAGDVSKDIYFGNVKTRMVGLVQYRRNVGAALASGSKVLAERALAQLASFEASHTSKAALVKQAWQKFQDTGVEIQVVRTAEGTWQINAGPLLTPKEASAGGHIRVFADTPKVRNLISGFGDEATAITKTLNELTSAVALKFPAVAQGVPDVPNVPQAREVPAQAPVAQPEAQTEQGPTEAGLAGVEGDPNAADAAPEPGRVDGASGVDSDAVAAEQASPDAVAEAVQTAEDAVEGQNQSTDDSTGAVDGNPEAGTQKASDEPQEGASEEAQENRPTLSILNDTSPEGTPFNLRNLIADHFTQAAGEQAQKLAVEPNLLSRRLANTDSPPPQVVAFLGIAQKLMGKIRANLPPARSKNQRHYDPMQFLLIEGADGLSDLDENVKTAMALSVFNWTASEATGTWRLDKKQINKILGKDKDARVSPRARSLLDTAGTYHHLVVDSLGGAMVQALGLKAKSDAGLELEPRLRVALGLHALHLAETVGLVKRTVISAEDMAGLRGTEVKNTRAIHEFIAVARDDQGKLLAGPQKILDTVRGSKGAVEKFFGATPSQVLPEFAPIKKVQKTTSRTQQGVPRALAKVIRKNQASPRTLIRDKADLMFGVFSDDQIARLLGIEATSSELTHKVNRPGRDAKNEGLLREYTLFRDWVSTELPKLDTPFFLPFNVWKQHRVGIASNVVNPQTSKFVRFMIGSPEWTTTVDPNNQELMSSFWLRVADGLGINIERQSNAKSIAEVQAMVAEPAFVDAIAALQAAVVDRTEITEDQKFAIVNAVGSGRLHALDVLIGLARMQAADGAPFEVRMMGEADGVANGTMLNHALLGAGSQAMMNRGGFFEVGNAHTQYNLWHDPANGEGNLDIYETVAKKIYQSVGRLFPVGSPSYPEVTAIWKVAGDIFNANQQKVTKEGRNLVKDANNPLSFGSALESSIEGMSEAFLDAVYEGFEKLAAKRDPYVEQSEIDAYVDAVNLLGNGKHRIPKGKPMAWHMENVLSPAFEREIQNTFINTVGMAVEEVFKAEFALFLYRRNQLNRMAQTTYGLFDAVYRGMREAFVEELIAKGEIEVDKDGPVSDLSKAQEAELLARLESVMPVVETSMSQRDQDNTGLLMVKHERAQQKTRPYRTDTKFGQPVPSTGHMSATLHGIATTKVDPGVAMGSGQTHSFDSGVSHDTQAEMDVLNNHDAVGAGVGQLRAAAEAMNKHTWLGLLKYSPLEQQHQALARVIEGIAGLVASGNLSPQALANLKKGLPDLLWKAEQVGLTVEPDQPLLSLLAATKSAAVRADTDKLNLMKTWASVDQYAYQGGNYAVTAEDRAEAAQSLADLKKTPSDAAAAAAKAIQEALKKAPAKGTVAAVPVTAAKPAAPEDRAEPGTSEEFNEAEGEDKTKSSPFGSLGKPTVNADPEILAFFKASPVAKAQDVVRLLNKLLADKASPSAALMRSMLPLLMKTLPADMSVRLVTAKTQESDVIEPPRQPSVGWFVGGQAYVLSPDFKDSALQPEVLLHELIHGALVDVIANPSPEAKKLVAELEALMQLAADHAKATGAAGFEAAFNDVQEFVAYGLSNRAFQRQVLSQISMPSKTGSNTLVTGMKAFIDKVMALVFHGSSKSQQEIAVNGLTVLVQNVSGLFMAANEAKQAKGNRVNLSMAAPSASINDYSTLDIHAALNAGAISPAFSQKIADVLSQVVQKLHGPFGTFKAALMQNQAADALEVWAKAQASGAAPFASSVLASPLQISEQEAHAMEQVEATMREVLSAPDVSARAVYRELVKLYGEMASAIKPSDFNSQAEYNFVFKVELDGQGRSNHLARFAAFGLANEQVNKLLQRRTAVKAGGSARTFSERLQGLFERALEYLQDRLTHTFAGQQADQKLKALVFQLVDIEGKRVAALQKKSFLDNIGPVEGKLKEAADAAVAKVVELAGSDYVRAHPQKLVRATGATVRVYANNQVGAFVEALTNWRNDAWQERLGFFAGMVNYATSADKVFEALLRLQKKREGQRKDIITNRAKMAREMFANSKTMSKETSGAITKVFLRSGLHALTDRMSMQQIAGILGDKRLLAAEISALEKQLGTYGAALQAHFVNKANALGYHKATGQVLDDTMLMNAHNIAMLYVTGWAKKHPLSKEQIDAAKVVIEQLVALNAVNYAKTGDVTLAHAVLVAENQRAQGEPNGVGSAMALQKEMERESQETLFQGQEALMQHGWTPEILNHSVDFEVAGAQKGAELEKAGYVRHGLVEADPADPDQSPKALYVMKGGGASPLLTGIVAYSDSGTKGTRKHSGWLNPKTAQGLENASLNAQLLASKKTGLDTGAKRDLSKGGRNHMVPVLNAQGEVVNWRYMMADHVRDSVLERDNRFDRVLGLAAGSIFDKQTTTESNARAIQALKEQYDAEGAKYPQSYVLIGPDSQDADARETWALLPYATKQAVRQVWGADGMYVQQSMRDIVFGYRKESLADAIRSTHARREENAERATRGLAPLKGKNMQEEVEQGMAELFTQLVEFSLRQSAIWRKIPNPDQYAMQAAAKVASAERAWQEVVRETKDLIVVKSISVLVGNVRSNLSLLLMSGVPISDVIRDHLVALRGATAYQKDSEELDRLQTLLKAGLAGGDRSKLERKIVLIKDSLERNPVRELIEAGLMPSIVEDTSADDDIYSYKSQLTESVEEAAKGLHPMVRRAANEIYMGKDTLAYQGLRRFTQLSDFMARYTQYQHLVSRKESPLSKADAMQQASDDFVNYDIPMPRRMQYLDDTGIFMFTKYFMRIQKVILRLTREKPGRVLGALALDQFMALGPIVLDSSWVGRVGNNPLSWGALQYPGSLDELATVSAGMALVK